MYRRNVHFVCSFCRAHVCDLFSSCMMRYRVECTAHRQRQRVPRSDDRTAPGQLASACQGQASPLPHMRIRLYLAYQAQGCGRFKSETCRQRCMKQAQSAQKCPKHSSERPKYLAHSSRRPKGSWKLPEAETSHKLYTEY